MASTVERMKQEFASYVSAVCSQQAERAVYLMKQNGGAGARASAPVSSWQLEEAQVFWAKGEQGLALSLLREIIHTLEEKVTNTPIMSI